jgi:SAM-dependent methyltransferase
MVEPRYGTIDASNPEGRRAVGEGNRASWNEATKAHNSHKVDQARFFRDGGVKLHSHERHVLGDISGLSVLHLQCNSGQDTLSLKNFGAAKVAGVDISDEAIEFARKLSAESGLEATFHRADVYDWLAEAAQSDERWDIVFCSYGAIIWLADLATWAQGIAAILKPGGRFVTAEFHPIEMMYDEQLRHVYPYSTHGEVITFDDGIGDYIAYAGPSGSPYEWSEGEKAFQNPHPSHEFAWGTSEIITALLDAGLVLEHFREYEDAPHKLYDAMSEVSPGVWTLPDGVPKFPLVYTIAARKP